MNLLDKVLNKVAETKVSHFWIFFAVLLILACITTYCHPGVTGHDFFFHRMRLDSLMEALRNGSYPIYLDHAAVNGYGYLTNVFYCDILLVPFAIIGLYTDTLFAYKVMLFTMTMSTGVIMYHAVNTIFKSSYLATISAILYTFSYYRLLDMYARAALGETLSFIFVPLVLLGLYHIIKGDYRKWYIIAIGFSLMIFSHVISSVLMFVTVIIFLIIYYKPLLKEPKRLAYLCLAAVVTLILIAYYLYPMVEQIWSDTFYYQTKPIATFGHTSKGPFQIIQGLFSGVIYQKNSFLPGIGFILVWAISLRIFISEKSKELKAIDICLAIGVFFIYMSSIYFPWNIAPFSKLSFIQYPWRLYEFTTFFFALAGAYYVYKLANTKIKKLGTGCLILFFTLIMIGNNGRYFTETFESDPNITPSINNYYLLQGAEYLPSLFPSIWYAEVRGDMVDSKNNDTQINNFKKEKGVTSLDIILSKSDTLELPLLYYKGYSALVNNEKISVTQSKNGLVEIAVEESGDIEVRYSRTYIQKASPYISLISIIALCIYILLSKRKKTLKTKGNA